ncbi:MAG TPA: CRISPR-associated endonuclease Cas2 [Hellea balneolensis]|uniref:CRISPR-associated endoribonuclease Cas2 n=1 Tax=Hellea balneolensis TaxID=287478 RepID=A0A7C5LZ16_9PROT|nr:CRISPR-associated endonuclease Cas2 [Hellea balneolensis]
MSATEHAVVISYDISHNRTRRKVADRLEEVLCRVQKSVFEGRLKRKNADNLFDEIAAMLDTGDNLRMYVLTKAGLENSRSRGGAPLPEETDFWLL